MLAAALLTLSVGLSAAEIEYRLKGTLEPPTRAVITLDGFTTTFTGSVLAGESGQFEIKGLRAGTYTLIVGVPNRGEIRKTVEIGPGTADDSNAVRTAIKLDDALFSRQYVRKQGTVSMGELAIPDKAKKAYAAAQRHLARRDQKKAIASLQEAVRLAPAFSGAWNNLGTLYYKSAQYEKAEQAFRSALMAAPESFEPLVNLGGVLLTLQRAGEAYTFNLYSVLERPEDALANSQMGMNYFELGRLDLARKYLNEARRIDPAHFSRPQLLLAEICLRQGDEEGAASVLEEYLRYHPDAPNRARIEEAIRKFRSNPSKML
jgi:tetratricopeptide (TPR) repeat protein